MAQNIPLNKRLSIESKGMTFEDLLANLQKNEEMKFAYKNAIIPTEYRVPVNFNEKTILEILDYVCTRNQLVWLSHNNQIVLREAQPSERYFYIKGIVKEETQNKPIPYASVYMKRLMHGVAADGEGEFELRVSNNHLNDTVIFSFLGYQKQELAVKDLLKQSMVSITLKETSIMINSVEVRAKKYKSTVLGNDALLSLGSLYLDTHGQQVALYMENDRHSEGGYIATVSYYLSKRGNTDAPFRVRLFLVDSVTRKPGNDMFYEVLIVKPENDWKGWHTVDLRQFRLKVPEDGFFVAMQGVYPDDYNVELEDFDNADTKDEQEEDVPEISYGQRLGYSKNRRNRDNTWHYSLSHTWFQLKNQPYGVMISAEIKYESGGRKELTEESFLYKKKLEVVGLR